MKFIGLILLFIVYTNSQAIADQGQFRSLNVGPASVADDHSHSSPEKIMLIKADERLGLWRTEKGDLMRMIPFVGESKQEPSKHVHSFVRRRQDSLGMESTPLCDLAEGSRTKGIISSGQPNKPAEGARSGRTFWPFYDPYYEPYYPPMPPPMPYQPYPPYPMGPPMGPMYPPMGPW